MADPGYQIGVGEDIGIHSTTVCKNIWQVAQKIYERANEWIHFPASDVELAAAMQSWSQIKQFPSAIGAIDCTHVDILKPSVFGDEYINRKGRASFNVQAICDANAKFLNVDCSWPGSVHDSRIWNNCEAKDIMETNECGALLLGDDGYAIRPYLMTPYKNPIAHHELLYNRVHSKERVVIERAFGQLKNRFPILKGKVRLKTDRIPTIIICCFVLHNVAKFLKDADYDEFYFEENTPIPSRLRENLSQGQNRRNEIAHQLSQSA